MPGSRPYSMPSTFYHLTSSRGRSSWSRSTRPRSSRPSTRGRPRAGCWARSGASWTRKVSGKKFYPLLWPYVRCLFHQVLHITFLYKSALCLCSFSLITVWLCNFLAQKYWHKNIGAKAAHKMLIKLTTGCGEWGPGVHVLPSWPRCSWSWCRLRRGHHSASIGWPGEHLKRYTKNTYSTEIET